MAQWERDEYGVPVLTREKIEVAAESFLAYFDAECLERPGCSPLGGIMQRLQNEGHAKFVVNMDLGFNEKGHKYLGHFHAPSTTIYIDRGLFTGDLRFSFTVAHELGHFVFHRVQNEDDFWDTPRELSLNRLATGNPKAWKEWQANKFASSLLLPRFTVPQALESIQRQRGITRNLGRIRLDHQGINNADYRATLRGLAYLYQTSQAVVRIRLRELNLLVDSDLSNIAGLLSISDIIPGVLNGIEAAQKRSSTNL